MKHLLDPAMWAWCWIAYRLALIWPTGQRHGPMTRAFHWLLPFAGFYAYHEPDLPWRWSQRVRR